MEEREELEESSRSNNFESGGDGFSLTVDGMSNSIAMSFQWLDKVYLQGVSKKSGINVKISTHNTLFITFILFKLGCMF